MPILHNSDDLVHLSTCKQQHLKVVNTPTRLKTCPISICEPKIPRICFARELPTFENWSSCICHQVSGFVDANEKIKNFINKDNSTVTNAWEHSSIQASIPNIFSSSSNFASLIVVTTKTVLGFNHSKHTIRSGITILSSYLNVNLIAFMWPTKFSTIHKALKHGSNIIAIMLWAHIASKDLKKSKKGLITFITPSHIFLCKIKIYASKRSKNLDMLDISNNSTSMFIIKVIVIVKVFDNNQWPLDWISTHVETIGFKANVTTK
jgi:hypothetical protein